jgi:hypothetical protein
MHDVHVFGDDTFQVKDTDVVERVIRKLQKTQPGSGSNLHNGPVNLGDLGDPPINETFGPALKRVTLVVQGFGLGSLPSLPANLRVPVGRRAEIEAQSDQELNEVAARNLSRVTHDLSFSFCFLRLLFLATKKQRQNFCHFDAVFCFLFISLP